MLVCGLLITQGCGNVEDNPYGYKAESAIGGNGNPTTVTNTANSPAEMAVGDIYSVTFDSDSPASINFDGTDKSADFVLAINTLDTGQTSRTVQLSDGSAPFEEVADISAPDKWDGWSTGEAFDQQLRGFEAELSVTIPLPSESLSLGKALQTPSSPKVGDYASFKVLGGLSSLSSYTTVRAKIQCVGEHVIFYVDMQVEQNNSSDLTSDDVQQLCDDFDVTAGKEFEIFGEPSDIDNDGHVAVLMTPQVNKLGAMGGGIITGFFFANDLYSGSNSNAREVIYVMVPDSKGTYGMTIPKSFAMGNLLPAVLPHELQHAISYNQKVFMAKGSAEENWLNEAMSHLSEDILGYGQENPSRAEIYLSDPSAYGPISTGSPNLAERGASFLFMRYLYEQAADGNKFIYDLLHSDLTGTQNLEMAFAGTDDSFDQTSEFLLRWTTAVVMSSFNLSTDPRFSYKERTWNSETNHWEGACLNCNTNDGRGTVLTGADVSTYYGVLKAEIESTASKFYQITSFPQEISLKSSSPGTYGATLIRFK